MDLLATTTVDTALADIVTDGLPPVRRRAHVIVVGAGMAGLVAATELRRAGHEVTVLEARSRAGGRIRTVREGFADGLAAEMGAMRIPEPHRLTLSYVERFGLTTAPFRSHSDDAYTFIHDRRRRATEPVDDEFDLAPHERGLGLDALVERSTQPLHDLIAADEDAGWAEVTARWGRASLRQFLEENGWSPGAVEMFGILARHESLMDSAFLEFFRGSNHGNSAMVRIVGGMDQLPNALLAGLRDDIRYGAAVRAVEQGPDYVRAHYDSAGQRRTATGDYLVLTVPYSVARHLEFVPALAPDKQRAIRQIHYDSATKIVMQFRRRFWEDEGISFGSTVTDLPIRNVVYPEVDVPTRRGLLIASYTWSQDALRWGALPEQDRLAHALDDLARIHPSAPDLYEGGTTWAWQSDPFAAGAYTVFQPGQEERLHDAICRPEGRVHFAGEHTSLLHRWIEGAVESGLRVALEVSTAAQQRSMLGAVEAVEPTEPCEGCALAAFHEGLDAIAAGHAEVLADLCRTDPTLSTTSHPGPLRVGARVVTDATLLHAAAASATAPAATVSVLLEQGADATASATSQDADAADRTLDALTLACASPTASAQSTAAVAGLLLAHGADPDRDEGRALWAGLTSRTVARDTRTTAEMLHRRGSALDLALAAGVGATDALTELLSGTGDARRQGYRPRIDHIDPSDQAALLAEALVFAARADRPDTLAVLLAAGADPSHAVSVNGVRRTALHDAAEVDSVDCVTALLDGGADPGIGDSEWATTAYAWAVHAGAQQTAHLLAARTDLSVEDLTYRGTLEELKVALGETPPDTAHRLGAPGVVLRAAATAGRRDLCEFLVARGANPALTSPLGLTAADLARGRGHSALADWLDPAGPD